MDNNLRETTLLFVEIMNSKRQLSKGETLSRTNSRWPFDVNVMVNLSNFKCLAPILIIYLFISLIIYSILNYTDHQNNIVDI